MPDVNLGPFAIKAETDYGGESIHALCLNMTAVETIRLTGEVKTRSDLTKPVATLLQRLERQMENLILSLRTGRVEFVEENGAVTRIVLHYTTYDHSNQGELPS